MARNPYGDDSPMNIPDPDPEPDPPPPKKRGWGPFRPFSEWGTPTPDDPPKDNTRRRGGNNNAYSQGNHFDD